MDVISHSENGIIVSGSLHSSGQWETTGPHNNQKGKRERDCVPLCLSGTIILFQDLNDWLPRGGKSSRLSCCSLAGIPRIQLSAPDSCFYSWVTVIVLTLVAVTKNGHLTHFFWRIHLNTGVRLTSLASTNAFSHPRVLLSSVRLYKRNWISGETKRIEQFSLLKTLLLL